MATALILMIDPSAVTRSMYGDCFRHAGYDVAEAADATTGLLPSVGIYAIGVRRDP